MRFKTIAAGVLAATAVMAAAAPASAEARSTITVAPESVRTIRGDVLWMTIPGRYSEKLAPFALDYRGRWCWAPPSVYGESCTMLVSRRRNGRRTLDNGSGVPVRVTYTRRF